MEIEVRCWCRKRDCDESSDDLNYTRGGTIGSSHWSGLRQLRDRSHETMGCRYDTPHRDRRRHPNATLDATS